MRYFKFALPFLLVTLFSFSPRNRMAPVHKKAYKSFEKFNPDFVFIPGGTWTSEDQMNQNRKGIMVGAGPVDMNITQSFWMSKYEVSNAKWQGFVKDISQRYGKDSAVQLLPDSTLWSRPVQYQEPMRIFYYRHPAYANYPVVNITLRQCEAYCQWLAGQIQGNDDDQYLESIVVRLPTDLEWEYAASSGKEDGLYPWGTDDLRNSKGVYRANFRQLPVHEAKKENGKIKLEVDYESFSPDFLTSPVNTYGQNNFGLYQMGGNVAEFVTATNDSIALEGLGILCGGSFFDPPHYMKCHVRDFYSGDSSAHFTRGFRPVITFQLKSAK